MNQNKNMPLYSYENIISQEVNQQNSALSIFNFQKNDQLILEQSKVYMKNAFSSFISSRTRYLTRLNKLGDNWISGNSKQPTLPSIDLAKDILNNISYWYEKEGYKQFVYPKIIMSPTPAGGIAMEIEGLSSCAYITISDDQINCEIEHDGLFVERNTDKNSMGEILTTLYNSNERGYYSERGVLI